jgi:GNAT superfamily N-acetyltransferase
MEHEGRAVARYQIFRGDPPTADLFEATAGREAAAAAAFDQLPGWLVATADPRLADELVSRGATQTRHSHVMTVSLRGITEPATRERNRAVLEVDPEWKVSAITPGFRFDPSVVTLMRRAYPKDHPDAETGDDSEILDDLHRRSDGERLGPLLPGSFLVEDRSRAVGLIIVSRVPGVAPFGGPWVSDVCRDPLAMYKGLGTALLVRAMNALSTNGETDLSLAVTVGNPAEQVYEALGFAIALTSRKVEIPKF